MNRLIKSYVSFPPIVEFKAKASKINPETKKTFDLTQAVPNFPTFEQLRERLSLEILKDPSLSFYTPDPGLLELRQNIAAHHPLKNYIDHSNILITAGANHAMYTALTLYASIGDPILMLEPYYFNYDMAVKMMGLHPVYHQLREDDGFKMRAVDVIKTLKKTKAKIIIVISPNNPTGACYDSKEIIELLKWTSTHGVRVLFDETYLVFDKNHLTNSKIGSFLNKGLSIVGSFSKSHSLTGYRVGYLVTKEQDIQEALKVQDTMIICAPHIGQRAAILGLKFFKKDVLRKIDEIAALRKMLLKETAALKNFKICSSGAFFGFLSHPFKKTFCEEATLEIYKKTGILGLPGTAFGPNQQGFIRLSFCNLTKKTLKEAIQNLILFDKKL